jgi:transcriptional regulator with XRE-family HTH domain
MSDESKKNSRPPKGEESDRKQLGIRLREAREYLGLLQEEVANYLGIPRTALSHIESGRRRIDALELKRIAMFYKQPVGYFTGENLIEEGLPKDVAHLARAAAGLSERDREELKRFAEYLRSRAVDEGDSHG